MNQELENVSFLARPGIQGDTGDILDAGSSWSRIESGMIGDLHGTS